MSLIIRVITIRNSRKEFPKETQGTVHISPGYRKIHTGNSHIAFQRVMDQMSRYIPLSELQHILIISLTFPFHSPSSRSASRDSGGLTYL